MCFLFYFIYFLLLINVHLYNNPGLTYMVNSFHLDLLKQYYQYEKHALLNNSINIEVHEDNILKYDYSILPNIHSGNLHINYMDDDTVQIKCTHLNQGKPETLIFRYDPHEPSIERFSIKSVVERISNMCKKSNKRHRYDGSENNAKSDQCAIYYNQLFKKRKIQEKL